VARASKRPNRDIIVAGVARPEPNLRMLARALLAVATKLTQEPSADTDASPVDASERRDAA
jgi:hypothetical protein